MKHLFLFCVFVVLYEIGESLPVGEVTKYVNDLNENGYHFEFETSDGIRRSETGNLLPVSNDEQTLQVNGQYEYYLQDGTPVSVTYTASEDGYRPRVVIGKAEESKEKPYISIGRPESLVSLVDGGLG